MEHLANEIDVLMISEKPLWPLDQGFRIRGQNMALALKAKGFRVAIACMTEDGAENPPAELTRMCVPWPEPDRFTTDALLRRWDGLIGGRLRRKVARFQGVDPALAAGAIKLVERLRPAVVLGLGQHSPMMLRGIPPEVSGTKIQRIWYAADELISFQLSCLRRDRPSAWADRAMKLGLYGAIETLFVRGLDGTIGVSPADTRLLRLIAGARRTITIRNGVDLDYYSPADAPPRPRSLAFWGRLDFEPNIDAVCWFAEKIWPRLHEKHARSSWTIMGKNPSRRVMQLTRRPGVTLLGAVDDIRTHARAATAAILPMRCGGGIKNKLLEAAAMGLPIVASRRAVRGLDLPADRRVLAVCDNEAEWVEQIGRLWSDAAAAQSLRRESRAWVEKQHSWAAAAETLAEWTGLVAPAITQETLREAA